MCLFSTRVRSGLSVVLAFCAFVSVSLATTAPVLDIYGTTLTSYKPTTATSSNGLRPRFDQRGVDIDGTLRQTSPLGWAIAADPLGGGYSAGRTLGDVNLDTGSYQPTEVDLAFPSLGLPVMIGRTFNNLSSNAGTRLDCGGVVGVNWAPTTQPEIVLFTGTTSDLDVLYLVYGADRYIEFQRIGVNATEFKAKNGAAGVVQFTLGNTGSSIPDLYTYFDQRGNQIVFFGFDASAAPAAGQLWKMIDTAGNTAYAGDSSTAATAISTGYTSLGKTSIFYDASGRRYTFTYATFGGLTGLLQKVEAEIPAGGGSWTSIGKVEYDYYTSTTTTNDIGLLGDLKTVTITLNGVTSGPYVRTKYYRYYTRAWSNSDGRRGEAHQLRMVVGFEGVRQEGSGYGSATEDTLMPYAESYFEYVSGSDYRLKAVTFNGNCGCSGGSSGRYIFTYTDGSTYSTEIGNTSYDTAWARRTVVQQPDGTYVSQYFDETGAVLGRAITNGDPTGSPSKKWVTDVERNSSGQVTAIHSPENITSYTHSSGVIAYSTSVGQVTVYGHHTATDNLTGLRESVSVKPGTSGTATTTSSVTLADVQFVVGSSGVSVPTVATSSTYPDGSTALTASITTTYWSTTNTNVQFIAPQSITIASAAVTTGNNGSGSATSIIRYTRTDGSSAFSKDAGGIFFYNKRDTFGQSISQIADCNTSSGDINTSGTPDNDTLSAWTTTGSTSGAIHAKTTMTYDDQGRPLTRTVPSVSGTRATTWKYVLDSARLGTFTSPLFASSNYYGPLSYSRVNHAGRADRRATIEIGSPSSTFPTSTTPNTTSGTAWSGLMDTAYDLTGMRAAETWTYTSTTAYDIAYVGYDAMGRIARTADATGTIRRTVFDERGLVIERWLGSNDYGLTNPGGSGSGTNDLVKIEALEYDSGSTSGGGNGYLTKRSQDSTGAWSGGVGDRVSTYQYDYRGRAIVAVNPVAPHSVTKYDNSNRVVATGQYSSSSGLSTSTDPTASTSANRVTLSETAFDERGQVFRSTTWEIVQSSGAKGSSLTSDNWYDDSGRLVKTFGRQIIKTAFDRLGRTLDRFVCAKLNDTTYANALDIAGDNVLEQTHSAIDPTSGRPLAQWTVQRAHDDAISGSSGALDTNADGDTRKLTSTNLQANARAQISATWYDAWDRVIDSVSYGTNGGTFDRMDTGHVTPPTRTSTLPPTFMRTSYTFDGFGRVSDMTDPASIVNHTAFDFAGRKSVTQDNYVYGANPGSGTNHDQNRETDYAYTNGLMTSVKRVVSTTTSEDQITAYAYDTTGGSSQIKAKNLLTTITNPDSTTTAYTYNALSQMLTTTDPAGNVIASGYVLGGRVTSRTATTISTTSPNVFDTRVKEIDTSYENRGMIAGVLQKDTSAVVLDEVAFVYDGWGNMNSMTQDPDSAISGGSGRAAYGMTWTYAANAISGGWKNLKLTNWTQPDGTSGGTSYSPSYNSGIDVQISRASSFKDGSSRPMADYTYMGVATVVGTSDPENLMALRQYGSAGSSTYDTYLDQFNRPIVDRWQREITGSVQPKVLDLAPAYDVQGNVVALTDAILHDGNTTPKRAFDMLMTFDNLRRQIERDEGQVASGAIATGDRKRCEMTSRNSMGRITVDQINLDWNANTNFTSGTLSGKDAGEMDDARMFNLRNQLTSRTYSDSSGGSPYTRTLTYDYNGNLTADGEKYTYKYNPWGQLVEIDDPAVGKAVAYYHYNGLGHRIAEQQDCNNSSNTGSADGWADSYDPWFYIATDPQGRRVATYRSSTSTHDTYPKETYVYNLGGAKGPAFTGGVLVRDRNASLTDPTKWATEVASSTRAEGNYYLSDFRGNVAALVSIDHKLVEQYRYGPSGVPYGIPLGDMNCDGVVDGGKGGADYVIVGNIVSASGYEDRADLDLDGAVSAADKTIVNTNDGHATGRGTFSVAGVGNKKEGRDIELFGVGLDCLGSQPSGRTIHLGLNIELQGESSMLWAAEQPVQPTTQEQCDDLRRTANEEHVAAVAAWLALALACPSIESGVGTVLCVILGAAAIAQQRKADRAEAAWVACVRARPTIVIPPITVPRNPTTLPNTNPTPIDNPGLGNPCTAALNPQTPPTTGYGPITDWTSCSNACIGATHDNVKWCDQCAVGARREFYSDCINETDRIFTRCLDKCRLLYGTNNQ